MNDIIRKQTPVSRGGSPNPVDIHIGSRLRELRILRGLSQEKLGEKVGLTFQQIQKYERGANRIGGSRLYALSQVLEVQPNYFFEGLDGQKPAKTAGFEPTRESLELVRHYQGITDHAVKKQVYGLVRLIAEAQPVPMAAE